MPGIRMSALNLITALVVMDVLLYISLDPLRRRR
jgi:hypothetical protein